MTGSNRLTPRQLNRTLLMRQLLLERVSRPVPDVLDNLCGIQNQNAPNAYLRLWSCIEGFQRDELTKAYQSGKVVQGTMMRGTIHTVSAGDYHPLISAVQEPMQAWARRVHKASTEVGRAEVVERVRAALHGRSLKRDEFLELVADAPAQVRATIHTDAEVVRVPPSGTWEKRRADLFGLADDSIGRHRDVDPQDGRRHLVRRYLAGFGPQAPADIGRFCGIAPADLAPTLDHMRLREFFDDGTGERLLDIDGAPIASGDEPVPIRFLPSWDSILLVHARRTGVIAEKFRPIIFHVHVGQCPPTFMVDGTVAGAWHWDAKAERVKLEPFAPLPRGVMGEVESEALLLAEFHR